MTQLKANYLSCVAENTIYAYYLSADEHIGRTERKLYLFYLFEHEFLNHQENNVVGGICNGIRHTSAKLTRTFPFECIRSPLVILYLILQRSKIKIHQFFSANNAKSMYGVMRGDNAMQLR